MNKAFDRNALTKAFAVIGASGQVGAVVAERLLANGHRVRAISRSMERIRELKAKGAEPYITELTDAEALSKAFSGCAAAFTMIPPNMSAPDYREFQGEVGQTIADAISASGVSHVVNLSSVGAHLPSATGPIAGLHAQEQRLERIAGLNVLHLRAAYFMENTYAAIRSIQTMGSFVGAIDAQTSLAMIATRDVGMQAAGFLSALNFQGHLRRELLGSKDLSHRELVPILGRAIGKPELSYARVSYDSLKEMMAQAGMPEKNAELIAEMVRGFDSGLIKPLEARSPENTTATSIEVFSNLFAARYRY